MRKNTTRKEMQELKDGDKFTINGVTHVADGDSHYSGDATYDGYIVYDQIGNSWFEDDFLDDEDAEIDQIWNFRLWDVLRDHLGHKVEIAVYGDPDDPASVTLEDLDTNEVIFDAGIYTLATREDM